MDLTSIAKAVSESFLKEEIDDALFCHGRVRYDWDTGPKAQRRSELPPELEGQYEKRLKSLFRTRPTGDTNVTDRVIVLIGGIGAGKTTALDHASRVGLGPDACAECRLFQEERGENPQLLRLDMSKVPAEGEEQDIDDEAEAIRFWTFVSAFFSAETPCIECEQEIKDYWWWCLQNRSLLERSEAMHRFLLAKRHEIKALREGRPFVGWTHDDLLRALLRERETLIQAMSAENLAWYHIFHYRFVKEARCSACPCTVVWLDNIDHASPAVQKLAVRVVWLLADTLKCKAIVTIRPLTWQRSIHGHSLITTEAHYSPDPGAVLERRFAQFTEERDVPEAQRAGLRRLLRMMCGMEGDPLLSRLFRATSGLSVRWAIRNFVNMVESPVLSNLADQGDPFAAIRLSQLVRAYLFGTRNSLIPQSFEDLYCVGGDRGSRRRLLKPRILDLLIRNSMGYSTVRDICGLVAHFGHSTTDIIIALNELLLRTRPLIWCERDYVVRDPDSVARIMTSPIGESYYGELFGELLYDEACIATNLWESVPLSRVYDNHKELSEIDESEVRRFVRDYGSIAYQQLYPADCPSLAFIHARNLLVGLSKRTRDGEVFFDPERPHWLGDRLRAILGES